MMKNILKKILDIVKKFVEKVGGLVSKVSGKVWKFEKKFCTILKFISRVFKLNFWQNFGKISKSKLLEKSRKIPEKILKIWSKIH